MENALEGNEFNYIALTKKSRRAHQSSDHLSQNKAQLIPGVVSTWYTN